MSYVLCPVSCSCILCIDLLLCCDVSHRSGDESSSWQLASVRSAIESWSTRRQSWRRQREPRRCRRCCCAFVCVPLSCRRHCVAVIIAIVVTVIVVVIVWLRRCGTSVWDASKPSTWMRSDSSTNSLRRNERSGPCPLSFYLSNPSHCSRGACCRLFICRCYCRRHFDEPDCSTWPGRRRWLRRGVPLTAWTPS
jgi:hypothetical protein